MTFVNRSKDEEKKGEPKKDELKKDELKKDELKKDEKKCNIGLNSVYKLFHLLVIPYFLNRRMPNLSK